MRLILLLCVAGAMGVLVRFAVMKMTAGASFPWGTIVVNLLGCFLFGVILVVLPRHFNLTRESEIGVVLLAGFMGALTTFSTYAFDLYSLYEQGRWGAMTGYFSIQNGGGMLLFCLGLVTGKFY